VGGLTEARRVVRMARARDLIVVPHAWKTGISVAVAAHLAMVTPEMPFFEFLPAELCETRLRTELVQDELVYRDGTLGVPELPGLGVELNAQAVAEFSEAARRVSPA
jgi:L-alanine-DL-glutamate epimerase-like enolase superfamily enzyme